MKSLIITPPMIITPRLLAGVKIGPDFISIETNGQESNGRTRYVATFDIAGNEYQETDLRSGCQGGDEREGMASLLSFLSAAAESYRYRGGFTDNPDDSCTLFSRPVVEWAAQNSDDIGMLSIEMEENGSDE